MLIKNQWYAIELGAAVTGQPMKVPVHGHDLVLYRSSDGAVHAQSDLCVHRGGALSGGRVVDDCLECPYHGWRYDADGRCVRIPANRPDLPIPRKARIDTYPCVERQGFVWAFLGDAGESDRPPPPSLDGLDDAPEARREGYRAVSGTFEWRANYDRVLENAVDIAHTPFVHAGSFGNPDRPEIHEYEIERRSDGDRLVSVLATVDLDPPAPRGMWAKAYKSKGERPPVRTTTGFYPPNMSMLVVRPPLGEIRLYTAAVPVDEHSTVSKFCMLRNFLTGKWADRDSVKRTLKIFREDRATVEGQRPELLPFDLSAELHVRSDSIQLAYRRWRQRCLDRGLGLPTPSEAESRRQNAVIGSPARAADPELAGAWVFPTVAAAPGADAGAGADAGDGGDARAASDAEADAGADAEDGAGADAGDGAGEAR